MLVDPGRALRTLCASVGVSFDDAMLRWERGPRATDGVWSKHWYAGVENSTGFEAYRRRDEAPARELAPVLEEAESLYARLHAVRLA